MRVEHFIWLDKIIESSNDSIICEISGLSEYNKEDINTFLALHILKQAKRIPENILKQYEEQKNNYLYSNIIDLPKITFTGKLAEIYIKLDEESNRLSNDPMYRSNLYFLFNEAYFGEKAPESTAEITDQRQQQLDIMLMRHSITEKIKLEIGAKIKTISVKQKAPAAILQIQTFNYDEAEFEKLMTIAKKLIKNFDFRRLNEDSGIIEIELFT